ncbi:uncharacterized protein LOC135115341 isoform X3 [Scylla paramamosain]|uniref:uncharacterized protein LOC135115341 isoform X3 n=2 Tax=Scylla paramamosain TaxID=85552 RepID=UPI003083B6AF
MLLPKVSTKCWPSNVALCVYKGVTPFHPAVKGMGGGRRGRGTRDNCVHPPQEEVEGRCQHLTEEEDVFYDSLEDNFVNVPIGYQPKVCGSHDEDYVMVPAHEDNSFKTLPHKDKHVTVLPCKDNSFRTLPHKDNHFKTLSHEDNHVTAMPLKDNHFRTLPCEDNLSRPLPCEDNLSTPLSCEDNLSKSLLREDNILRPLTHEDNLSRPLPHESNLSRHLPHEDNLSRPLPREDNLSRPLPREDNLSRPLPCKDNLSRPLTSKDNLSKPLPHEDNLSKSLPHKDNLSRSLPCEDNLLRSLPHKDNHATALPHDANCMMVPLLKDNQVTALPQKVEHRDNLPCEDEQQMSQKVRSFITEPVNTNIAMDWEEDTSDPFEKVLARRDCQTNHSSNQEKTPSEKIGALLQSLKNLQAGSKQQATGTLHHYADEDKEQDSITQQHYVVQHDSRPEQHYPEEHQDRTPQHYPEEHQDRRTPQHYPEEHQDRRTPQHYPEEHQDRRTPQHYPEEHQDRRTPQHYPEEHQDRRTPQHYPEEHQNRRIPQHYPEEHQDRRTPQHYPEEHQDRRTPQHYPEEHQNRRTPQHYPEEHQDRRTPQHYLEEHQDRRTPRHYPEEHQDRRTPQHYPEEHQDTRTPQLYPEEHQDRRTQQHYSEKHHDHMTPQHYSDEDEEQDNRTQHYKDGEHGSRSQHPDYSKQERSSEQLYDSDNDEQASRAQHQQGDAQDGPQHHNDQVHESEKYNRQQHYQDGNEELATRTLQHDDEQSRIQQHYCDEEEESRPQHHCHKDEASRTLHAGQERHNWGRGEGRGCVRGGPHWMGQCEDHTHTWRQERLGKVQDEHGLAWRQNYSWRIAKNDHQGSHWNQRRQQHSHPTSYYRGRDHNMYNKDEGDTLEPEDLVSALAERPQFHCTLTNLFEYQGFASESVQQVAAAHPHIFHMSRDGVQLNPQVKLCWANLSAQGCTNGWSCLDLHVCSTYISSWCQESPCPPGHSLYTEHNKAVLRRFMLEHLSVTHLKKLLKHLIPIAASPSGCLEVCRDYNRGQCNKTECQALHLCLRFVVNRAYCDRQGCSLNHNPHDPACSLLLISNKISVNENIKDIIVALLNANPTLVPKDATKPLPPPQLHTRAAPKDTSSKPIGKIFNRVKQSLGLAGATSKNEESSEPHTQKDKVTLAQITTDKNPSDTKTERSKESGQDSSSKAAHKPNRKHPSDSKSSTGGAETGRQTAWTYHRMGNVDIAEICRFSVEGICLNEDQGCRRLHASQPFHWQVHKNARQDSWFNLPAAVVTCLEVAFCDPTKNGVKLPSLDPAQLRRLQEVLDQDMWYANFEAMVLTNSDYSKMVALRRLCVQADAAPQYAKARTFSWFFCDVRGRWVKYGQADSTGQANLKSSITSADIEAHYLARPDQPLSFRVSQFKYLINFGAMTQTNQTTQVQRAVRRRPELHPSLLSSA